MTKTLFFLLLFPFSVCLGQDTINLMRWDFMEMYPLAAKHSKYSLAYVFSINDGPIQPIGVLGENIGPYLRQNKAAHDIFLDYQKRTRRYQKINRIARIGMYGGILIAAIGISADQNAMTGAGAGLFLAGGITEMINGGSGHKLRAKLEESVRVFNSGR